MLDFSHLPVGVKADIQVFRTDNTSPAFQSWQKPRGVSMVAMFLVGQGGKGGNGAVGAAGAASGGGGGASGAQTFVCIPAHHLPDMLWVRLAGTIAVLINPTNSLLHQVAFVGNGGDGGNASGATPGAAGGGSGLQTANDIPYAARGVFNGLASQAGIVGAAGDGQQLILPTTGLTVTGGGAGGGVYAIGSGGAGGGIFGVTGFPPHLGGGPATAATVPGAPGSNGFDYVLSGTRYSYGGTGGGASYFTATGAGLFGGNGGNGGIGCGGGGGGGCLTGGVAGVGGHGGFGQITMIAW